MAAAILEVSTCVSVSKFLKRAWVTGGKVRMIVRREIRELLEIGTPERNGWLNSDSYYTCNVHV